MAKIRSQIWLLILALCLTSKVLAHNAPVPAPLPDGVDHMDRFQPFAGDSIVPYSGHKKPNQGYFFTYDWLSWYNRGPVQVPVGQEWLSTIVADGSYYRQGVNSLDTGMLGNAAASGNRFEFGFAGDHWGWMGGVLYMNAFETNLVRSDAEILFRDQYTTFEYFPALTVIGPFSPFPFTRQVGLLDGFVKLGPLYSVDDNVNQIFSHGRYFDGDADGTIDPTSEADVLDPQNYDLGDLVRLATVFRTVKLSLRSDVQAVELMPFYRFDQFHKGGNFDFLFGVRYFKYTERFGVYTYGEPVPQDGGDNTQNSTLLGNSHWQTNAQNNLVGPQLGGRWMKQTNRWIWSAEGRFMAAYNFQNINQLAHLENAQQPLPPGGDSLNTPADPRQLGPRGLDTLLRFTPRTATHTSHENEFSPLVEIRANLGFQVTKALNIRAGWTGIWANGIARPSSMVEYALPVMGIRGRNRQDIFLQGFNLGVEFNR